MKKTSLVFFFIMISFSQVNACDICGCGVGNFNPFMFPHLSKNFFSVGYQYRNYHTHFFENGAEMNNRESYNTLSITGQYSPHKNLQLMAVIPFQMNRQSGMEGNKSLNRFGDMMLLANYKLWDHTSGKSGKQIRQTFQAGGGIKFATGSYKFDESDEKYVGNSNFQAGSGSTDYLMNIFYTARYKKMAFSSGINYKINTDNKNGYQFGNRFTNVTQVKYIRDIGSLSIIPSAGIMIERMAQDKMNGVKVEENKTGGYNTQALLGVDINSKKWALGINYSASLKQNLSAGQIHAKPGLNVHLSYSF